jgi:hypothetical protein
LAGCSNTRVVARDGPIPQAAGSSDRATVQPATAAIGARLKSAALDDRQLGDARGGLSAGTGLVVTFSFQEAIYVNHNLTQSVVIPTITVSPGSFADAATTARALEPIQSTASVQPSLSTQAFQSILNDGMTSVLSSLGDRGVTSTVRNAANNQLVQQSITANIGITGLSQTIRQNVAALTATRLAGANSQFR